MPVLFLVLAALIFIFLVLVFQRTYAVGDPAVDLFDEITEAAEQEIFDIRIQLRTDMAQYVFDIERGVMIRNGKELSGDYSFAGPGGTVRVVPMLATREWEFHIEQRLPGVCLPDSGPCTCLQGRMIVSKMRVPHEEATQALYQAVWFTALNAMVPA